MCASETMTRDLSLSLSLTRDLQKRRALSPKTKEKTRKRRIMASVLTSADEIEPKRSFFLSICLGYYLSYFKVSFFTTKNSRALSLKNDLFAY